MAKVWCASAECEHNRRNICRAKEINLAAMLVPTRYDGFADLWKCRTFQLSERAKELKKAVTRQQFEKWLADRGDDKDENCR